MEIYSEGIGRNQSMEKSKNKEQNLVFIVSRLFVSSQIYNNRYKQFNTIIFRPSLVYLVSLLSTCGTYNIILSFKLAQR